MLQPLEYDDPTTASSSGGHDSGNGVGIQLWDKVCSCALVKSPSRPLQGGQYKLCGAGIRDVATAASTAATVTMSSSSVMMTGGTSGGEGIRSSQMEGPEANRKRPHP